jgi:hypothetical protein
MLADAAPVTTAGPNAMWHQRLFHRDGLATLFAAWAGTEHMAPLLELMATVTDAMFVTLGNNAGGRHNMFPWTYAETLARVVSSGTLMLSHPQMHTRAMVMLARLLDVQAPLRMTLKLAGSLASVALHALGSPAPCGVAKNAYRCFGGVASSASVPRDAAARMVLMAVSTRLSGSLDWAAVLHVGAEVVVACDGGCGPGCCRRMASAVCAWEPAIKRCRAGAPGSKPAAFAPWKCVVTPEEAEEAARACVRWSTEAPRQLWVSGLHRVSTRGRPVVIDDDRDDDGDDEDEEHASRPRQRVRVDAADAPVGTADPDEDTALAADLRALLGDYRMRERANKPSDVAFRMLGEVAGYVTRFL